MASRVQALTFTPAPSLALAFHRSKYAGGGVAAAGALLPGPGEGGTQGDGLPVPLLQVWHPPWATLVAILVPQVHPRTCSLPALQPRILWGR